MAVNVNSAIAAYRSAAGGGGQGMAPREASGQSFSELLGTALEGAVDAGKTSEAMSTAAMAGKADLGEVVAAVTNAELTLQTVVAVRDRVIQAYQDIIRMPI